MYLVMLIYSYTFNSKANMFKVGKAVYSVVCENSYGKDDGGSWKGYLWIGKCAVFVRFAVFGIMMHGSV